MSGRRPQGSRSEKLRVVDGFLESQPPLHQVRGQGSTVSSPSGVRGGALTAKRFYYI